VEHGADIVKMLFRGSSFSFGAFGVPGGKIIKDTRG